MQPRYAKLTKMGCPKLVPYDYVFMNPMFQQMNSVSPYSGQGADYKTEAQVILKVFHQGVNLNLARLLKKQKSR